MMKITNNYTATVILPPNDPVHRGHSINYPNWDAIKDMPNIAWYVEKGLLLVEDAEYPDADADSDEDQGSDEEDSAEDEQEEDSEEDAESEPDEKTKLIADLAGLGVEVDGRTGLKKLRALLEEKLAEQE